MHQVEKSGTRVASAKTLFANDDIVSEGREAAQYLTFLTHEILVLVEMLSHRGLPTPMMDESFLKKFMREVRTSFGEGEHTAR